MSDDPWSDIGRDRSAWTFRRSDPTHPADFFWARSPEGRCGLVLIVSAAVSSDEARPQLNGIDMLEGPEEDGRRAFFLVLRRDEDRDLFAVLCDDIIETCRVLQDEQAVLVAMVRRTWKWHSLLRGGGTRRLSAEEQQGLAGELLFLQRLATQLQPAAALQAWRGPLDEPKDFAFGSRAVEVKARHATRDVVKISSEHQLQLQEGQTLFLVVYAFGSADGDMPEAFTLDSLVDRVRTDLLAADPSVDQALEARLLGAGYSSEDGYADRWWTVASVGAYAVASPFPRLEATSLALGVSNVSYWLTLAACAPFKISESAVFPE